MLSVFGGSTLSVDLIGSSYLRFADAAFDFVDARIDGSALFEYVEVRALPAGHIEVSGSSNVSVNMMDFATLTGSVMGSSTLGYYGNGVNLNMLTSPTSTVIRLGASR